MRDERLRCEDCGRFLALEWASRHAWFAYEDAARCPECRAKADPKAMHGKER